MWYENSIVYQIYPLGAAGAPFENDGVLTHRLKRFETWIEDLEELGVDVVLFNPLFQSKTHGYDTSDFHQVDVRLGDQKDLQSLCTRLQEAGIEVMFDAVFNHVGRDFGPFLDVLKNREASAYKDWFQIDFHGSNSYNDGLWYANWEGYDALVKLNLRNPEVVQYLLDVVDEWIELYGIKGLRLDVAYCMDKDFLKTLSRHVREKDPEFFLFGEMIHGDYNQIVNDDMLPSCTNYEANKGIYSSFNSTNFFEILYSFNRQFGKEPWCLYTGKPLMAFLDNHDTNRIASSLQNKEHLPLAYAMLMTMPGIPIVYYGSEWGMEGIKNANDTAIRPEVKELEHNALTDTIQKLIEIHHAQPAFSNGSYQQIAINNGWCTYARQKDGNTIYTSINMTPNPVTMQVGYHGKAVNLMTEEPEDIPGSIFLEPCSFKILRLED